MGRRRVGPRSDFVELTLVGSSDQDAQVLAGSGRSRLRSSKGKSGLQNEKVEVHSVCARCSFSKVYDVIHGFSERKKELVRETGFGGLLFFPPVRQLDKKFLVWLMCRVDALEHCIVIDDNKKIKFDKDDVGLVFGIPSGGRRIVASPTVRKELISKVWCKMIGIKDRRNRSIKAVLKIIQREYGPTMSLEECVSFKLAFVVYVLSTVLTPGSRYDYVCLDYLDALEDPTEICSYDWSDYVFRKLINAITQMRNVLRSTGKAPTITGCSLFLQVLYLDSIDLGVWTLEDKTLPRVSMFSGDRLKHMIYADTKENTTDRMVRTFGTRPLLPPCKVVYSWARCADCIITGCGADMEEVLRQATVSICLSCDKPVEEAPRLFDAVARIDMDVGCKITAAVASFIDDNFRVTSEGDGVLLVNNKVKEGNMSVVPYHQDDGQCSYGGIRDDSGEGASMDVLLDKSSFYCCTGEGSDDEGDLFIKSCNGHGKFENGNKGDVELEASVTDTTELEAIEAVQHCH